MSYAMPQCITDYLTKNGYTSPFNEMSAHISRWKAMLDASGEFWDYTEFDGFGTVKCHRRSVRPAQKVVREWASLILTDDTIVSTEDEACNEWLDDFLANSNFLGKGQKVIEDAFGLGTAAWVLWYDGGTVKLRRYDARMIIPLSWDEDGITECAFASRCVDSGKTYEQIQLHVLDGKTYHIKTALFTKDGKRVSVEGIEEDFDTRGDVPWFAIVTTADENRVCDFSPYGQSIFAGAEDVLKSVDTAYDALYNEIELGKLRIFLSDMLIERREVDGTVKRIPFGQHDRAIYRKVSSTDDDIKEFAPSLRVAAIAQSYDQALRELGEQTGLGARYFGLTQTGGLRTATEVSADNSVLMRNIKRHEKVIRGAIIAVCRALLHYARTFAGVSLGNEGVIRVTFDDSIITDTATEKAQDMAEVGITMNAYEYREKWYGEDEETARANVPGAIIPLT